MLKTKVNLTEELSEKKLKEKSEIAENSIITETQKLLAYDSQEDSRIMRGLGRNHSFAAAEEKLGQKLEMERLDGKYAGNVFTAAQIESLARKYHLRFLSSRLYTGKMDVNVATKIKEFNRETGTLIDDASLGAHFFIMAPASSFMIKEERRLRQFTNPDPAIFYKIDHNHYRLVHQWGADFSIVRRILGYMWDNPGIGFVTNLIIATLLCLMGIVVATSVFHAAARIWSFMGLAPLYALFAQAGTWDVGLFCWSKEFYSSRTWNSDKKVKLD